MAKRPYCGFEADVKKFKVLREPWRFRFYTVWMLNAPSATGYSTTRGISPRGKQSMFAIRVRPRRSTWGGSGGV